MSQGSFCVYFEEEIEGKTVKDAIVGQNFKNSLHLMVSKEDSNSLTMRYLWHDRWMICWLISIMKFSSK